jgi:uncharacterized protein YeaC (DUF1315 family)
MENVMNTDYLIEIVVEDAVQFTFGDWPEGQGIGTSDVSACVNQVMYDIRRHHPNVHSAFVRMLVNKEIARVTGE